MKTLKLGLLRGRMEIKVFMRGRESVVFTLLFPVILLFIFGSVFKNTIAPGVTFSQYFVAGMIASGLVNTGFQQLAITIPMEREFGTLKRLRGRPISVSAYFIGKAYLITFLMILQTALLLGFGVALFGLEMPTSSSKWLTFTWLILLGSACSIVIILQFFSGVFFVFSELPTWMQQFAALFPLKWLTQGMRSVFLPESFATQEVAANWELGRTAIILIVWLIVGLFLAIKTFKWSEE
jgi:ABC-2 type transport system permease protein